MKFVPIVSFLFIFISFSCNNTSSNKAFDFSHNNSDSSSQCVIKYARGFDVSYQKDYTILTINNPWQGASNYHHRYYLVKNGNEIPEQIKNEKIIRTPIEKIVCLSTTHIAFVDGIGKTDCIVGVSGTKYINNQKVRNLISKGKTVDVGYDQAIDYEKLIAVKPDVVMAYGIESNISAFQKKAEELGINVVMNAEYLEETPLAKTEWIKFVAVLFGEETIANQKFNEIETQYLELTKLVSNKKSPNPKVLTGLPWNDTWYVPGGQSFAAKLIEDAGGSYLWKFDENRESIPLTIEAAFEFGKNADFWINTGDAMNCNEIANIDERLKELPVFYSGKIFNNNKILSVSGGNDYWESGIVNPQLILKDLIYIFHPELLPNHTLVYYRKLTNK